MAGDTDFSILVVIPSFLSDSINFSKKESQLKETHKIQYRCYTNVACKEGDVGRIEVWETVLFGILQGASTCV